MEYPVTRQHNSLIITPSGRLDFDASPEFQTQTEAAIDQAQALGLGLIIDCAQLNYISSAGLRAFLMAARSAKTRQVGLMACGLTPPVQEVFDLSGFSQLIPLCTNLSQALSR